MTDPKPTLTWAFDPDGYETHILVDSHPGGTLRIHERDFNDYLAERAGEQIQWRVQRVYKGLSAEPSAPFVYDPTPRRWNDK